MTRRGHQTDLAAVSRFKPDRGQEILAIPVEGPDAIYEILWYFAVLAYPDPSDSQEREYFAKALHSWRCKNARKDMNCWKGLPPEIRSMTNRNIKGKRNMGLNRIAKRLEAGSIALSLYLKDRPVPGFNPTTRDGMGVAVEDVRVWDTASRYSGGISTVTEGLEEILRQKGEMTGKGYDRNVSGVIERDAIENARTYIWNESLTVLHHAVTLHNWLRGFPCEELMLAEVYRLIHDPVWLRGALVYAEDWRVLLDYREKYGIPSFDKDKAIRIISAD